MNSKKETRIVVLCGSTRFLDRYDETSLRFTLKNWIVLSVGSHKHSDKDLGLIAEKKEQLDELHKRKIEIADLVYIINVEGYIGHSTRSEIEYAKQLSKPIEYLEEFVKCDDCSRDDCDDFSCDDGICYCCRDRGLSWDEMCIPCRDDWAGNQEPDWTDDFEPMED